VIIDNGFTENAGIKAEQHETEEDPRKATEDILFRDDFPSRQYTNWENPDDFLDSGYGKIKFIAWAALEKKRIEEKGGIVTIWEHPENNKVCLTLDHEFAVLIGDSSHYGYKKIEAANW
jgi:hypothetical protein